MFRNLFNKMTGIFSKYLVRKAKVQIVDLPSPFDPENIMQPYEEDIYVRRHATWYNLDLEQVNKGEINYKI